MSRELMPWSEDEAADFERRYSCRGCTCFISPPCGYCTHPGNPRNLEETLDAWALPHEVKAAYATIELANFIDSLIKRNLVEMAATWLEEHK